MRRRWRASAWPAPTLFAGLAVLGQSRGAVLAAGISLALVFALLPGRLRRVVALLVSAACLAPALPALLDVYRGGATADELRSAAGALLLAAFAAGAIWAGLVAFEQRAGAGGLRLRRAVAAGVTCLALAGAAFGVASAERIGDFVDRQYTAFVTLGGPQGEPTASRLATGAGNRYDYWRIAVDAWRANPIAGVGAGGYDKPYFAQRTTSEDIRQPHSLPLQVLAELGIVGGLLFATALIVIAAGTWRRIRDGGRAPVVVAGLGVVVGMARAHERGLDAPAAGADRRGAAGRGGAAGAGRPPAQARYDVRRRLPPQPFVRSCPAGSGDARRHRDHDRGVEPQPPGTVGALRRACPVRARR